MRRFSQPFPRWVQQLLGRLVPPLDSHDMERRDWVPGSGWPFGVDELNPYYERGHPILHLGPVTFDIDHWVKAINRPDVRRMPLPSGRVYDGISQFSPPMRFGQHYRSDLKKAKHIRVYLYANVVDIETESTGQTVRRVQVKTLSGRSMSVEARQVVLATGGIREPPRLARLQQEPRQWMGQCQRSGPDGISWITRDCCSETCAFVRNGRATSCTTSGSTI
jgi:glycine/D-amino acid oxidase-like deaminating enzyme